jgi:nucleotide-binding universal stress UspA family protein
VTTTPAVRTIVVGVDESAGAADALRWGVAEGELRDARVTALMAWGFLDQHHGGVTERLDPSYGQDDALAALRTYITDAVGSERAPTVRAKVVCDLPARALLDASARADLLVVGARGLGGFGGLLLGSVSSHCLHHTTRPIVIVRGGTDRLVRDQERVVVAVDGSPAAQRALRWALAEGTSRKAIVQVINAWRVPVAGYYPNLGRLYDPAYYEAHSSRLLREALAAEGLIDLPDSVGARPVRGDAAAVILDAAQDADLVVMGTRGPHGLKRIGVGSVTAHVSRHAECPVVVIPPD